jgi:hypothetical protein
MFFQFTSEVTGLAAHLGKSDALEFCFDSPRVVSVRLSMSYPDGLKPKGACGCGMHKHNHGRAI